MIGHDLRTTLPDPARTRFAVLVRRAVWLGSQWKWKQGKRKEEKENSARTVAYFCCANHCTLKCHSVRSVGSDVACIFLSMARQCEKGKKGEKDDDCRFSTEHPTLVACLAGQAYITLSPYHVSMLARLCDR